MEPSFLTTPPVAQLLDDSVGRRSAPAQFFVAELGELCTGSGLIFPEYQAKAVFTFKYFGYSHDNISSSLLYYTSNFSLTE